MPALHVYLVDKDTKKVWLTRPDDEDEKDFWSSHSCQVDSLNTDAAEAVRAELEKRGYYLQRFQPLSPWNTSFTYPREMTEKPSRSDRMYALATVYIDKTEQFSAGNKVDKPFTFTEMMEMINSGAGPYSFEHTQELQKYMQGLN